MMTGENAADLFADTPYDASTLASMIEAFAAACFELGITSSGVRVRESDKLRLRLVTRILKAAAAGERDPDRMTLLAMRAVNPNNS